MPPLWPSPPPPTVLTRARGHVRGRGEFGFPALSACACASPWNTRKGATNEEMLSQQEPIWILPETKRRSVDQSSPHHAKVSFLGRVGTGSGSLRFACAVFKQDSSPGRAARSWWPGCRPVGSGQQEQRSGSTVLLLYLVASFFPLKLCH